MAPAAERSSVKPTHFQPAYWLLHKRKNSFTPISGLIERAAYARLISTTAASTIAITPTVAAMGSV
jgi:hypothetical protein